MIEPAESEDKAALDRALVHALRAAWHDLNALHFRRQLMPPSLALSAATTRLGQWRREERVLEISRPLCYAQPWGVVVEVLKHEMAHQFVAEVMGIHGGIHEETAHGPAFTQLCEKLGIDARAAGLPAAGEADDEAARVLRRVAKLLALGESSNQHEAEAATAEAQRLMLKHNLETAATHGRADYCFRHVGRVTGRVTEPERALGNILAEFFFVESIWVPVWRAAEGKRGSVLELCGSRINVDLAEHVYAFVLGTGERLWEEHKRRHGIAGNRDRLSFLAGAMAGYRDKLAGERRRHAAAGLVWVGDPDLGRYLRKRHPRISWTRTQGVARTEAHGHGRAAGRNIVVSKPVSSSGSGGRLLVGR